MAELSWPFENADTTESQYSKLLSRFAESGVLEGLTVSTSSGLNLSMAVGSAIVRGFYYENDSAKTLAVSTANATNPRRDYIVLRLDLASNSIVAAVKAGTATAGGGTLPSLTQTLTTWEHPIAVITVPAGASNLVSGNIENRLNKTGLRVVPYATSAERDWISTSTSQILGVNTTNRTFELWTGTEWLSVPELITWSNLTGKPSSFTPAAHVHAIADVTNLQTNLTTLQTNVDGKANTSHTHTASAITDQENLNAGRVNGVRIFVQSSQPSSPSVNDLWFWG
jgi:hypothetical protein